MQNLLREVCAAFTLGYILASPAVCRLDDLYKVIKGNDDIAHVRGVFYAHHDKHKNLDKARNGVHVLRFYVTHCNDDGYNRSDGKR